MTSFRLVLTWSSRLTVETLGVIGPGRSATAESSACQHPVKPKNVTTGISREDPSYCFNGSRLTGVNPCAGFRLRRDGIASGSTVEADGGQVGGRGAPRPSAPESAHQQWGESPHRTEHWLSVVEGNCVVERRGGEQPEANCQSINKTMLNTIRPDALASLLGKGEAQNRKPTREGARRLRQPHWRRAQ